MLNMYSPACVSPRINQSFSDMAAASIAAMRSCTMCERKVGCYTQRLETISTYWRQADADGEGKHTWRSLCSLAPCRCVQVRYLHRSGAPLVLRQPLIAVSIRVVVTPRSQETPPACCSTCCNIGACSSEPILNILKLRPAAGLPPLCAKLILTANYWAACLAIRVL